MTRDTNSGRSIDEDVVYEAFRVAIEWFHDQLDRTISDQVGDCTHAECKSADECTRPTTGREYFERRGWSDATISEWKLGYAPGDGGLADHLRDYGYGDDVLHATGLFTKNLTALWRGRYVLPYLDEDGRAVYAIARSAGAKGGGAVGYDGHPEDFLAGKYAKVAHTKDHVPLSEPIFGRSTLGRSEDIVIAEGIADAITASTAGYTVLSPVTTQFKREHFEELLDLVDGEAQRVFVIPDSERAGFSRIDSDDVPAEPDHIYQAINIPKVAPGLGGALRTANYLCEHDVDARVVELPRAGLRKVDLDDYLNDGWADDLDAVLRNAQPPAHHPAFDVATDGQLTTPQDGGQSPSDGIPEDRPNTDSDLAAARTDGMSALWDLPIEEVNPDLEAGYRGKNPLGHVGDSENYFQVFCPEEDADLLAVDYKRKVKYNGLTYLLVEIKERDVVAPEGPLTPEETWKAWSAARERGLIGSGDTIPTAALRYIAEDRGYYDFEDLPEQTEDGDPPQLPAKAHNLSLWWVEEQWWPNTRDDEDETQATARSKQDADRVPARTWEDVRYCYEQLEANKFGRHAARQLLRAKHDFMTLAEWEQLYVYDAETGTFTAELSEINGEIADGLGVHWSSHERSEILEGIKQYNVVESRHLNGRGAFETPHICVENGVLDLFTRELKPHSPDYHFVDRVPVTFDRDAPTDPYEDFLDDLTSREEDALTMMEMVGHALVPDANERYKKFLVLHGGADNGKTEFFDRVSALLQGPSGAEGNVSNVKLEKLASNRFSSNSIYGHMANIAGEIDGKKIRNTATLKDISGGDRMEIEPKGADSFFDKINATLMFAANDPPIIGERDKKAVASRIAPVELPFTFTSSPTGEFEKQKRSTSDLDAQLATDEAMSGFLNLALDGIERLEANDGDVSLPESELERLNRYESAADPMAEFADRCLENHATHYLVKDDVTAVFKAFAEQRGHEVGGDIHATLHSVIKGSVSLNYADGRPQSPDYATTSLPLRPWNERKRVIKRITLTDEGLQYAREAGLVVDDDESEQSPHPTPSSIAALEPGERVSLTVCAAGVIQNPRPWLSGEGTFLLDEDQKISYHVRGDLPRVDVGREYELTDAVVGTTTDGEKILEMREGMTSIAAVEDDIVDEDDDDDDDRDSSPTDQGGEAAKPAASPDDGGQTAHAVANGGEPPADGETVEASTLQELCARGTMFVRNNHEDRIDGVRHEELVDHLVEHGASEDQAEHAIKTLRNRGDITVPAIDHYRA